MYVRMYVCTYVCMYVCPLMILCRVIIHCLMNVLILCMCVHTVGANTYYIHAYILEYICLEFVHAIACHVNLIQHAICLLSSLGVDYSVR